MISILDVDINLTFLITELSLPEKLVDRINAGAGWFMTKNILTKAEYVMQTYSGDGYHRTRFEDGKFSGIVVETVISF